MGTRQFSDPITMQLFMSLIRNYTRAKTLVNESNQKVLPGLCNDTLTAYPTAIMVWESYLHERLLSPASFLNLEGHLILELKDKIENWDLETKTYVFPKWILGKTFDKASQPFQDFRKLIQIRNSIVHFKWDRPPLNTIKDLAQRKITIYKEDGIEFSWIMEISSINCYKWAINTIVDMIHTFESFFPEKIRSPFLQDVYKKVE